MEANDLDVRNLQETARRIRVSVIRMMEPKGGHYGGSLSCVDILTALYFGELRIDPGDPAWPQRDRFVLSKGHAAAALYATLAERGFFPKAALLAFNKLDSPFGSHPDMRKVPGVDMSTGSLGHGLPVGVGMALGARLKGIPARVVVLMGDGELQEGTVWEAAASAAHYRLSNLLGIVDRNRLQIDGSTDEITCMEPLAKRWESFGWHVLEANGHDFGSLSRAFEEARRWEQGPTVILASTVKGKGVSFMEDKRDWHNRKASPDETRRALEELGEKELS